MDVVCFNQVHLNTFPGCTSAQLTQEVWRTSLHTSKQGPSPKRIFFLLEKSEYFKGSKSFQREGTLVNKKENRMGDGLFSLMTCCVAEQPQPTVSFLVLYSNACVYFMYLIYSPVSSSRPVSYTHLTLPTICSV